MNIKIGDKVIYTDGRVWTVASVLDYGYMIEARREATIAFDGEIKKVKA